MHNYMYYAKPCRDHFAFLMLPSLSFESVNAKVS